MKLFGTVLDILFPSTAAQAIVLGASLESIGRYAHPSVIAEGVVALLPYRRPLVRACVTEAKFKDSERAQNLLAGVLADYLNEWSAGQAPASPGPIVLVPVPLSKTRLKERGYNQAERIARLAAARLPDVYLDTALLARVRDTLPQTTLGRAERRANVKGAFAASGPIDASYTYIVFDDVMTTGATLGGSMEALKRAGAGRVLGIALAH